MRSYSHAQVPPRAGQRRVSRRLVDRGSNARRSIRHAAVLAGCWIVLTGTLIAAPPASMKEVRFGPDFSLTGRTDPSDLTNREVSVAVNPLDPLNAVAGFHEIPRNTTKCGFSFTIDGGQTWTEGGVTPLQRGGDTCFDVSVAADADGVFYYAFLDSQGGSLGGLGTDIGVSTSTDGGASFDTFSIAVDLDPTVAHVDKPYMGVDAQIGSPFKGTIYVSYTNITAFTSEIEVVVSRDGGLTWSAPVTVSRVAPFPPDEVQGSLPVVAPDGSVYVFYADYLSRIGPLDIKFSKSTNGGLDWTSPADVATGLQSPGLFELKNANPDFGIVPFVGLLGNSFPTAAIAPNGKIYVAWVDFPEGSCAQPPGGGRTTCTNADVRLAISKDGGRRWSAPAKVSDDTGSSDQFLPWIAAHPDGLLSLIWLDRRLDPDNVDYDVFYSNTANGRSFLANVRINAVTSTLGTIQRIGEYSGLAVTQDRIFAAWPDLRFPDVPAAFTATGTILP